MEAIKNWVFHRSKRLQRVGVEALFGWKANTLGFSLSFGRSTEGTFQITLGIPLLFLVYFTVDFQPWTWWVKALGKAQDRDIIRVQFAGMYINFALWYDTFDWTKGETNGWHYLNTWKDLLCGDHSLHGLGKSALVIERPAVAHLNEPNGLPHAKWVVTRIGEKVIWKRWYMRLWAKLRPQIYYNYCVEPRFEAGFPGKNGPDSLTKLHVTTVDTPEAAIDYFNQRLTELQTYY